MHYLENPPHTASLKDIDLKNEFKARIENQHKD